VVVANHVLEHVDDKKASAELSRVLKRDGFLVCQVPIVEGWETTYEYKSITSDEAWSLHFGQADHVRFYGADFRRRMSEGGFKLIKEITAEGVDVVKHGLVRGEKRSFFKKHNV
jgi:predicted SAM-dependent methyltransferase